MSIDNLANRQNVRMVTKYRFDPLISLSSKFDHPRIWNIAEREDPIVVCTLVNRTLDTPSNHLRTLRILIFDKIVQSNYYTDIVDVLCYIIRRRSVIN